jgi:uncharacterized protein with PIN domain
MYGYSKEKAPMPKATFRFYEELNDFLPGHRKKTDFEAEFVGKRSIKDMIEAMGVPHTEVDLILANGKSVDFKYILQGGDRISVYPVFESINIEGITRLREVPLRRSRFIADSNIRDVVKYMRALGLDVYFDPSLSHMEIIEVSRNEKRIILTKSKNLLKFAQVTHGIYLRPGTTAEQIKRVVDALEIRDKVSPFSRCLCCNTPLETVSKEVVEDRVPPKVRASCNEYTYCRSCDQVYWKGTHFMKIKRVIDQILD